MPRVVYVSQLFTPVVIVWMMAAGLIPGSLTVNRSPAVALPMLGFANAPVCVQLNRDATKTIYVPAAVLILFGVLTEFRFHDCGIPLKISFLRMLCVESEILIWA